MLIAALVIIAKTANCLISTYRRMHINCRIFIQCNGILLINKKESLVYTLWMNLKNIKPDTQKYIFCMISFI